MNVIVLAGDSAQKALIEIHHRPMIAYVIQILKQVKAIEKIAVIGPVDKLKPVIGDKVDYLIEGRDSIVENGLHALSYFSSEDEVLFVTADIPMITVAAIEHFIVISQEQHVDLCYPIVDKKVNDLKCPTVKRTYARLWEGRFTGGNVIYFNPAAAEQCKDFIQKMFEYRKKPTKMAKVLGLGFLIRLAIGILTISAIKKKCERLLGIRCGVVISPYPEIGNDVDKESDIAFAEKMIIFKD